MSSHNPLAGTPGTIVTGVYMKHYNLERYADEQRTRRRRELGLNIWQNDDGSYWTKNWRTVLLIAGVVILTLGMPVYFLFLLWWTASH